jgi:hypothetical protein
MSENAPPPPDNGEDDNLKKEFTPRDAVWHTKDSDIPIRVIGEYAGGKYLKIEGSGTAVPAEQVEYGESGKTEHDSSVEGPEPSAEQKLARAKIIELFNNEQAKALRNKKPGFEALTDKLVETYDAMREAAMTGDFDNVFELVPGTNSGTSVKDFVKNISDEASYTSGRYSELAQEGDANAQAKLEEINVTLNLAKDAVEALEQVEIQQSLTPKSEEEDVKQTSEESQRKAERRKPKYLFEKGEIVKLPTKKGDKVLEWRVVRSFGHKKRYVELEDPEGKRDNAHPPEDLLKEHNPRAESPVVEQPDKKDSDKKSEQTEKERGNKQTKPSEQKTRNHEESNGKSPWLDPRFISEMRSKYLSKLAKQEYVAQQLDDRVSEHFKAILKTHIIEHAIRDRISRAEWLAGKGAVGEGRQPGFEPANDWKVEKPSEQIKQQMAAMLDLPEGDLQQRAAQFEEDRNNNNYTFKEGDRVKHKRANGKIEDWIVDNSNVKVSGDKYVVISKDGKGKDRRWIKDEHLKDEQEFNTPTELEERLEKLKPYINNPNLAKVKTEDGAIIKGQFQGYKISNGNVYYGYVDQDEEVERNKNKRLGEVTLSEFLDWQNQKTDEEIAAARQAKIDRINHKVPENLRKFNLDQEVKIVRNVTGDPEDKQVENGWIVYDFTIDNEGDVLVHVIKNVRDMWVKQDSLHEWQQSSDNTGDTEPQPSAEATADAEETKKNDTEAPAPPTPSKNNDPKLSWWEKTKARYDKLNNPTKVAVGFLGLVAVSTSPGIVGAAAMAYQHKRHNRKLKSKENSGNTNGDPEGNKRLERTWESIKEKWEAKHVPKIFKTVGILGASAVIGAYEGMSRADEYVLRSSMSAIGQLTEFDRFAAKGANKLARKGADKVVATSKDMNKVHSAVISELRPMVEEDVKTLKELIKRQRDRFNLQNP